MQLPNYTENANFQIRISQNDKNPLYAPLLVNPRYTCIRTCIAYIRGRMHEYIHACTYIIHKCMHAYIHTCIHTYVLVRRGFCLEGFVQGGFVCSPFCQNTSITAESSNSISGFICMMKIFKVWRPKLLSQTVTPRTPRAWRTLWTAPKPTWARKERNLEQNSVRT